MQLRGADADTTIGRALVFGDVNRNRNSGYGITVRIGGLGPLDVSSILATPTMSLSGVQAINRISREVIVPPSSQSMLHCRMRK